MSLENNETYNIIINLLQRFAEGHAMINSFSHGQIDVADLTKDNLYPLMHVEPVGFPYSVSTMGGSDRQMRFRILFFACPRDKEDKTDYQREIISDFDQLHRDLLAIIKNGDLFAHGPEIVDAGEGIPFMEEYANVLTGVENTITLGFGWTLSACDVPGEFFTPPGTISDVSGANPLYMLKSVYDPNLIEAPVVFTVNGVEPDGDGNVQVATGGGVDSVNGQTGAVELDAGDVGADVAGAAAAALALANLHSDGELAAHVAAADPHPQYKKESDFPIAIAEVNDLQTKLDEKVTANVAITGATKTKITYDSKGLVISGADATTADIADSSNKRYVTNADLVVLGNTSGTNTGDQSLAGLQPLDSDLTDIAALTPSNDDFIQRKAGAWTNRTIAQVKADLTPVFAKSTTDSASHTGTTAETLIDSILIPANTLGSGDILFLQARNRKTSSASGATYRMRFGTANNLSGTVIGTTIAAGTQVYAQAKRMFLIKPGPVLEVVSGTTNATTDDNLQTAATTSLAIDATVDNYFVFSTQLVSSLDTATFSGYIMEIK